MALTQVPSGMMKAGGVPAFDGIAFPATQVPSADANTLDDYEEGTFTPAWGSGVTSPVYAAQVGNYIKIGRMVYFSLRIALSGGTANATSALVTGLPFASSNSNSFTSGGVFAYNNGTVGAALPTVFIGTGSSQIEFYTVAGNQLAGTGFTAISSSNIYLAGCYMTNA